MRWLEHRMFPTAPADVGDMPISRAIEGAKTTDKVCILEEIQAKEPFDPAKRGHKP